MANVLPLKLVLRIIRRILTAVLAEVFYRDLMSITESPMSITVYNALATWIVTSAIIHSCQLLCKRYRVKTTLEFLQCMAY